MTASTVKRPTALRPMMSAAALFLAGALPASAAEWLFPASDPFYDIGANWNTGTAPGAGEAANFLGGHSGVIIWDDFVGSTTTASVLVDQAEVTFLNAANASNAYTHTTVGGFMVRNGGVARVGSTAFEPMFLDIAGALDLQGTAHFTAGFGSEVSVGNELFVGNFTGQTASVTIDGAGTTLNVGGVTSLGFSGSTGTLSYINGATGTLLGEVSVGDDSTANTAGVFNVTGGSVVTTGALSAGDLGNPGVSGTILVDGGGSRITQIGSSAFTLGAGSLSTGTLTVSDGGLFEAGTGTALIDTTGMLDLDTGGAFVGRDVQLAGTATINGGLLFADHLQLNGGTVLTNSNAVVSVNTMSGFGDSVTLNGFVTFGEPAGPTTAAHTVSVGQAFTVGQVLVVGATRLAVFAVDGGAATAGALRIADTTAANSSLVEVTNGGSLTVNGSADIGSAAGGVGTLTVSSDGAAEFGGTVNIFTNGFVSVGDTATLRANTLDNTAGGAFSTSAGSTVGFNNLTGFGNTISFAGDVRTGVDAGPDGGFHTVSAGQTFTVGGIMKVGADSGAASAEFNVDGGSLDVGALLDIASNFAGDGRDAIFRVLNGGVVNNASFSEYGSASGATATLFVDGAGSQWNVGNARLRRGTLTLSNGGTYHTANSLQVLADGVVNINAGGTLDVDGGLAVTGGTLNRNAGGTLDLAGGQTLSASNNAAVMFTGNYMLNDSTMFQVEGGSSFTLSDYLDIGGGSDGTLIVQGAGTSLVTNTDTALELYWGAAGGTADVTIRNGASATIGGMGLELGRDANTSSNGILRVQTGATVTTNFIEVAAGAAGSGTITVDGVGSALTQNGGSMFIVGGSGTGTGTVNLTNGGMITTGAVIAGPTVTGVMRIGTNGVVNLNGGTLIADRIEHTQGGQFNFSQGNLHFDTFTGDLTNTAGTLTPGGTPGDTDTLGTATINGDYTQQPGATLKLEYEDVATPGTTYDTLVVTGHFEMGGTLDFSTTGLSFVDLGDHFDLLDWGTRSGTFDQILIPFAALDATWNTEDLYTTGEISFELAGDLNTDGFVGVEDLDILLAHWGQTTRQYNFAGGDASGDGLAGQADLDMILDNWGAGAPPEGLVPEPGSAGLLLVSGLALLRRRRR